MCFRWRRAIRSKLAFLFSAVVLTAAESGTTLQPGTLPGHWETGGPRCNHPATGRTTGNHNQDFYILRESGCINYEKPFLYLIFGKEAALLEDTGAGPVQTASFVVSLLEKWAKKTGKPPVRLMVIHSHGHGDHTAGDKQFQTMASVQFVN